MKKLIKMFKGLPPEMRMFIAMAGMGTPLGAIYALKRWVFPGTSTFVIILYVAGVVAVICLLGFLITKLFGRGAKRRSQKMAAEMAGGSEAGPVSMDVRAAIKENNDRFFNAIKDMRKLGISIYELPWYVVIGDSGCGKTRLINEGGLTFSTGKPEGYQLGTLNYNWWFTEDAIFVDMAGRLCNPKEDSDFREWEAFLNTVKKGRKGFPINGVLACVSADHLLQDAPEKLEADANTMLERLRDLQNKLEVTFATYLVVTKCDKILGFMQYFDRAERDITVKNQMFGWSKPGDFKELYDPEEFGGVFQDLYGRLNELRLRRLNDDAEEIDLGLAYSFPEELRGLLEPLKIYVRTLFPAIRSPRAIKNLIFRGVYLTSATQEGSLILKRLTGSLGKEAADQFAPLDLYPNKRPHFIKDVFFRKVFPEQGLVFRNEEQAERNKKLAKWLNIGSIVCGIALVVSLVWSVSQFTGLMAKPREHALRSQKAALVGDAFSALGLGGKIAEDVSRLEENTLPAKVLSLWYRHDEPIEYLQTIQAGLFEKGMLSEALGDVDRALREGPDEKNDSAEHYKDALEQYITWYGCSKATEPPSSLSRGGFRTLCGVVTRSESIINQKGFSDQADAYFAIVGGGGHWDKNPARLLAEGGIDAAETIGLAIGHMQTYLSRYARLAEDHPDDTIREWMRIQSACAGLEESYGLMLGKAGEEIRTVPDVEQLRDEFLGGYVEFDKAFAELEWRIGQDTYYDIPGIRDAILVQRQRWLDYEQRLRQAYTEAGCTVSPDSGVGEAIDSLSTGIPAKRPGLDQVLWDNMRGAGLTTHAYQKRNYDPERFKELVQEVDGVYAHILTLDRREAPDPDQIQRTADARNVQSALKTIRDALDDLSGGEASNQTLGQWTQRLQSQLAGRGGRSVDTGSVADLEHPDEWNLDGLERLYGSHEDWIRRHNATRLLEGILARLEGTDEWGLAGLVGGDPRWCDKEPSSYRIVGPDCGGKRAAAKPIAEVPEEEERPSGRGRGRGRGRRSGSSRDTSTTDRRSPARSGSASRRTIPVCATRGFLTQVVDHWADLDDYLGRFDEDDFLRAGEGEPLNYLCTEQLGEAGRKYFDSYVRGWSSGYTDKRLVLLEKLTEDAVAWKTLVRRGSRTNVGNELHEGLATILGALPFWGAEEQEPGRWKAGYNDDYNDWMVDGLYDRWDSDLGDFVHRKELPSDFKDGELYRGNPAQLVAGAFVERWNALSKAIEDNADFRRVWKRARKSPGKRVNATSIPWGEIQELREQTGLDDEKFTQQLVDFEERARQLLSEELTDILWGIQAERFGDETPDEGWPYLGRGTHNLPSLDTVKFKPFTQFLEDVRRAEEEFGPLEERLGDDLSLTRVDFYGSCRAWRTFLKLDTNGKPGTLRFSVSGGDPMVDPVFKNRLKDTAHQYYRYVELSLGGLTWTTGQESGSGRSGPLRRKTEADGRAVKSHSKWNWVRGNLEFSIGLREGGAILRENRRYSDVTIPLGPPSELALCAYLRSGYSDSDGRKWKTLLTFDPKNSAELDKTIGAMFIFELERGMPDPIQQLPRPGERE